MQLLRFGLLTGVFLAVTTPAFADLTLFLGSASAPTNRTTKGVALGAGLLIIGVEFEYADTTEEPAEGAPGLRTGMGNVLLQTPGAIFGLQPYVTTGAGLYQERLGSSSQTQLVFNNGGGVKISLIGPVRARIDYRVLSLRGSPLHATVHRIYTGLNLNF